MADGLNPCVRADYLLEAPCVNVADVLGNGQAHKARPQKEKACMLVFLRSY